MPSHQSRCEDGYFRAFILINLQYCPAIWHHCSVSNTQKLEKNQEPALRYVTNVYKSDYRSFLLCQTGLHSLEEGRQQQIAIQTFKMVNNFSPPYLWGLITPQKFTRIHRNYVKTLEIPFYNSVRHGTNSFSFFGTKSVYMGYSTSIRELLCVGHYFAHQKECSVS